MIESGKQYTCDRKSCGKKQFVSGKDKEVIPLGWCRRAQNIYCDECEGDYDTFDSSSPKPKQGM